MTSRLHYIKVGNFQSFNQIWMCRKPRIYDFNESQWILSTNGTAMIKSEFLLYNNKLWNQMLASLNLLTATTSFSLCIYLIHTSKFLEIKHGQGYTWIIDWDSCKDKDTINFTQYWNYMYGNVPPCQGLVSIPFMLLKMNFHVISIMTFANAFSYTNVFKKFPSLLLALLFFN